MGEQAYLHCRDVSFSYRLQPVLRELNWEAPLGRTCGILGKNGEGKTTLFRLLQGFLRPSCGHIQLGKREPHFRQGECLVDVLYLPETCKVVPLLSLQHFVRSYKRFYPRFDEELLDNLCTGFEIDVNKIMYHMSFGQKKKALLSFAIATGTKVLLLDEPSNGLDIPSKNVFRKALGNSLSVKDRLVLISSHQVRDLDGLMSDIVILKKGQMLVKERLADLERRFFSRLENEPKPNAIYSLEVLGGYSNLYTSQAGNVNSQKLDIELLFQFILEQTEESLSLLALNGAEERV